MEKIVFPFILISAISSLLIYSYFSPRRYFIGDDFPLLISAQNIKSIFLPVGAHFRPVVRMHFLLSSIFGDSPVFFNFLSLFLHILATFSFYLVLKEEYNKKFSIFASLLFFSLFTYNETVFWISSIGVIYSFFFSMLSIYFFKRGKQLVSLLFLLLSSLSYETWAFIPFYFILSKRKNFLLIFSSILLSIFNFLFVISSPDRIHSYGSFPPLNEIPARISYYLYKNLFPFSYLSRSSIIYFAFFVTLALFLYFVFKVKERILLPSLLYFIPCLIFLMSRYIPSRFFYSPSASTSVILSFFILEKRPLRYILLAGMVYLSIISPIINYLDGMDYLHYSLMHKTIVDHGRRVIEDIKMGDEVLIINRFSIPLTKMAVESVKGSPKTFLHRGKGIGGLIDLDVFVNFLLKKKGLKSIPLAKEKGLKTIVIGNGNFVSKYSFNVKKR